MANEKMLNVRIKNKIHDYESWIANDPVLLEGEPAFVTVANVQDGVINEVPCVMLKVGDGIHKFSELDWLYSKSSDVYSWAKAKDKPTYSATEITGIADYIAEYVEDTMGISVDTNDVFRISKVDDYNYKLQSKGKTDAETAWADVEGSVIAIPNDTAAIQALKDLVGNTAVATQISNAITALDLANTYEAKGEAAKVQTALNNYQIANDAVIDAIKDGTTVDSFGDVETELAKKVDKVTGKSLVSDTEIARLAGMSDGANKVEKSSTNGNIKIDGVETVVYTHPAEHAISEITGLQDALDGKQAVGDYATKSEAQGYANAKDDAIAEAKKAGTDAQAYAEGVAGDLADHIADAEGKYETKTDAAGKLTEAKGYTDTEVAKVQGEVDALETLVGTLPEGTDATTVVGYIDAKTANIASDETVGALAERVTAAEGAIDAIEADYLVEADKTELSGLITAEKERAEGVEGGLRTDVDAIKADYLKAADKEALQTQINTIMSNPDAEGAINSINEFTQYVADHGTIAEGFRADIDKNKEDIAANATALAEHEELAAETYETKTDAAGKLTEAKTYADGLNTAMDTRVKVLEEIDHDAYVAADETVLAGAKTYADGLNTAMNTRVEALEAIDHEHENKTVLDGITAEKVAAWDAAEGNAKSYADTELAKKANDADLAAIAKSGNVNDLVQTSGEYIIFNCGNSVDVI